MRIAILRASGRPQNHQDCNPEGGWPATEPSGLQSAPSTRRGPGTTRNHEVPLYRMGRTGAQPKRGGSTLPSGTKGSATQTGSFYFTVWDEGERNPNGEFLLYRLGRPGAQRKQQLNIFEIKKKVFFFFKNIELQFPLRPRSSQTVK